VLRKMQITSLMCHETLLPVLREALRLGSGEADKSSSLRLVLDPQEDHRAERQYASRCRVWETYH
jgi:4-coumarate--CoA ligase